jgi:hypothetical protein
MASTTNMAGRDVSASVRSGAPTGSLGTGGRPLLIIGAWSGVVGSLLAFVANGLHPHPSDGSLEALLQDIAQNTAWGAIHLTLIVSLVLILGTLAAITLTTDGEPGATVARFACLASLVGGTLILVSTAGDGFAMNHLASSWMSAPPIEKANALRIADALEYVLYAVYSLSIVIFLGIGIFLYGLATILGSAYPKALGWLAMLSGGGAFVVGIAQALNGPTARGTEIFFVLFSVLSTIWVLLMGVLMWRKAYVKHAHTAIVPLPLPL